MVRSLSYWRPVSCILSLEQIVKICVFDASSLLYQSKAHVGNAFEYPEIKSDHCFWPSGSVNEVSEDLS